MTAVRRCSGVTTFPQQVLDDLQIERLLCDQPLELAILFLERLETFRLARLQAAVFLLPAIERLLGHPVLSNQVDHLRPRVPLVQHRDDLRVREPAFPHPSSW